MNNSVYILCIGIFIQLPIFGSNITFDLNNKTRIRKQTVNHTNHGDQTGVNNTNKTTEESEKLKRKIISRILLEGAKELIDEVPLDELVEALKSLKDTGVIPKCVEDIWKKVKQSKKGMDNIELSDALPFEGYFQYLPDDDLALLNSKHWLNSVYFGMMKDLGKQKVSILMSFLLDKEKENFYEKHENLNKLMGIICGLPYEKLAKIPDEEFILIEASVYENLYSCSLERIRWMLQNVMKPTMFGPPQVWNATVVSKLNFLLLGLLPEELISIRPSAMKTLPKKIIDHMDMNLIMTFTKNQVMNFREEAFLAYKKRKFLANKQVLHTSKCHFITFLFLLNFFIIF